MRRLAPRFSRLTFLSSIAAGAGLSQLAVASQDQQEKLSADKWVGLKLIEKRELTGGDRPTYLYRFQLPKGQEPFPVASCLLTRAPVGEVKEDGTKAFVLRPYTPISRPDHSDGELDLAVKMYPQGKFTGGYLASLKTGDVVDFKGPLPKLSISELKNKDVGMICGGTGLTPMLQIAEELLRHPGAYKGKISLIYANVSPSDIMLKDRVDALAKAHPKQFSVFYVVDRLDGSANWTGGVGYINKDMVKQHMPAASKKDSYVLVCGPPGMMKLLSGEKLSPKEQGPLSGLLLDLGYNESNVYKF